MGGGCGMSHSEFLKSEQEMKEQREYLVSYPAYIEGFQTPPVANNTAKTEIAKEKYPTQLFETIGRAYSEYLKPHIKNCSAEEVRFSVKAGQSLLQGKVTKKDIVHTDRVVIELQGRCNEQPLATDSMQVEYKKSFFNANRIHVTAVGSGFCFVNEDSSWIPGAPKNISHPGKGSDLRLLDHMLYIEKSLQDKTARVEIAPIIR